MDKYISRAYLAEKWRTLKWDMERTLDVYGQSHGDSVSEEELEQVKFTVKQCMKAIWKELGLGEPL